MSEIFFNSPVSKHQENEQVDNFQTTLALLNQQIISLREALEERDRKLAQLQTDQTLTIVGILINLYKFVFLSGKIS